MSSFFKSLDFVLRLVKLVHNGIAN